jgi:hypothetical protein
MQLDMLTVQQSIDGCGHNSSKSNLQFAAWHFVPSWLARGILRQYRYGACKGLVALHKAACHTVTFAIACSSSVCFTTVHS